MRIKDIVKESRPRERFLLNGAEALSDAELLALILRTGSISENVVDMSNRLISEYSLTGLFDCSIQELKKIKGIGESKAIQLLAINEISRRKNSNEKLIQKITCAHDVFDLFKEKVRGKSKEHFYVVLLDTKNKIISTHETSVGILDATIVHPREIFKDAIKSSASRIVLVHNHPSGDPAPSEEDLHITRKLIDSGELLGIEVIDHVIIGGDEYYSYCGD